MNLSPDLLYVVPLGGLGEIGKNMTAFLYAGDMIVVDAGVMFPKEDMPGIDFVIPDISFILQHKEKLRGIFLTHGHEDHIGALPYILPKLADVPVYGTSLTLGLLKGKLSEFRQNTVKLQTVKPGDKISCNDLSVEFFSTVHSIHDSVGLVIRTPVGSVVHSGDFKFDHTPVSGMSTDYKTLADLGKAGVLILLSDSTYAERPGYSASERLVRKSLDQVFSKARGRVILATFASSIPRIQQVVDAAGDHGRKVCFIGRSMVQNVQIARELGFLIIPENLLVSEDEISSVRDSHLAVVTTGSQGEPLSALSLMAGKSHKSVEIKGGDTVVISATPIPGNEGLVFRTINQLFRLGAEVVYTLTTRQDESSRDFKVHVQGHAGQEELKLFMNLVKPKFFIPIHGEYRHLVTHAKLAREVGIPSENAVVAVDGDIIAISPDEMKIADHLTTGNVFVHGYGIGEIGKSVIKERQALAEDGILVVAVSVKKETRQLLGEPELASKGFIPSGSGSEILEEARRVASEFLAAALQKNNRDEEILKGNLKGELNRFFGEKMGRKPIIIPVFTWL